MHGVGVHTFQSPMLSGLSSVLVMGLCGPSSLETGGAWDHDWLGSPRGPVSRSWEGYVVKIRIGPWGLRWGEAHENKQPVYGAIGGSCCWQCLA